MWCEFVWPMMTKIHCLIFITFLTYKMNTIHIASFSLELVISWFICLRSAVALILTVIAGGRNYSYIEWYHDWWIITNKKFFITNLKAIKVWSTHNLNQCRWSSPSWSQPSPTKTLRMTRWSLEQLIWNFFSASTNDIKRYQTLNSFAILLSEPRLDLLAPRGNCGKV